MSQDSKHCVRYAHPPHLLGRQGEDAAAKFLLSSGYTIIERNWRGSSGEVDIIARAESGEFVFVEVKTRASLRFGDPFEAITPEKYRRIFRLAREWSALWQPKASWRIDVILLLQNPVGFELVHHKGLIA